MSVNMEDYLVPTDPPVPIAALPLYNGENTISSTETIGGIELIYTIPEIRKVEVDNEIYNLIDANARGIIANNFNKNQSYSEGDIVWFGNQLYKCLNNCSGNWDYQNWSQIELTQELDTTIEKELTYKYEDLEAFVDFIQNYSTISSFKNNNVTRLRTGAFFECVSLQSVDLPVCSFVGSNAFWGCSSLQSISLPQCNNIENNAFGYCSSLQAISVPQCSCIKNQAFIRCISLQEINLPQCSYIDNAAFQNCSSLQLISLPLCSYIGISAFVECSSLQSIDLPLCNYIEERAFLACTALQSVNLPQCNYIGYYAFGACSLQSIDLPQCSSMGTFVFADCTSLQSINLLASSICIIDENTFAYTPIQKSSYLGHFGSIYVPSSLVSAYKSATNWVLYSDRITAYQG